MCISVCESCGWTRFSHSFVMFDWGSHSFDTYEFGMISKMHKSNVSCCTYMYDRFLCGHGKSTVIRKRPLTHNPPLAKVDLHTYMVVFIYQPTAYVWSAKPLCAFSQALRWVNNFIPLLVGGRVKMLAFAHDCAETTAMYMYMNGPNVCLCVVLHVLLHTV